MSTENKIVGSICLFFFLVIALLLWKGSSISQTESIKNADILVRDTSHMTRPIGGQTGQGGAKVTMVEFGDFECPACGAASPTINKIIALYKDNPDFNFVFRNFPLPQHKNALPAAEAAEAAGAQGKYFEMETLLYANQKEWSDSADPAPIFQKYAEQLKLDGAQFASDLSGQKFSSVIQNDLLDGQTLAVNHTPTVYINGAEQADLSIEAIKQKIDELLAK